MCEEEASVIEMRPVEKAAPALSAAVGGSVSCALSLDAAVLGDGGVTADSGDVGRHVSVGDVSVSCGCEMELCGIDTVVSDAESGGRCDLDSVSGGDDTDISDVDTVVSCAVSGCLCDSVSCGDVVVRVGEMLLAGGGDTVVSGVDESMCGDTSVITAGEFDVCACDSLVSGGAGDSSGAESVDDVVAYSDDAFRVGGWLSVVGLGVAQPGWVDELVCADDPCAPSLHRCTQCVCVIVHWQLPDI